MIAGDPRMARALDYHGMLAGVAADVRGRRRGGAMNDNLFTPDELEALTQLNEFCWRWIDRLPLGGFYRTSSSSTRTRVGCSSNTASGSLRTRCSRSPSRRARRSRRCAGSLSTETSTRREPARGDHRVHRPGRVAGGSPKRFRDRAAVGERRRASVAVSRLVGPSCSHAPWTTRRSRPRSCATSAQP